MPLDGLTAIVTGGTMGIGEAAARVLWSRGARVVVVARGAEAGRRLLAELGEERLAFLAGDLTDPATAPAAVELARERFGGLDVLVNNAAMDFSDHYILETPVDEVRPVFELNVFGALRMLQAAAMAMRGRGGSIVNVLSRLATIAVPGMNLYGATKGALLAVTRGAAIELAREGVRVNAVAPGFTTTPLYDAWLAEQPDPGEASRRVAQTIPQGRLATPQDVAHAIAFLASPEAGHITGALLPVDGGYTAQ